MGCFWKRVRGSFSKGCVAEYASKEFGLGTGNLGPGKLGLGKRKKTTVMSDQKLPAPPEASFDILISMLISQAAAAMGQLKIPGQEMPEVRMDYAKHFIDLLAILEEKTKGNVSSEESTMMGQAIHQLRMVYLQLNK